MPRIIECPIARYRGSITLPDYLNYEQFVMWEVSQREAGEMFTYASGKATGFVKGRVLSDLRAVKIPAILRIVEKWELENFPANPTLENFPATPAVSAARLYEWLLEEISKIFAEDDTEIPNA